MDEVIKIIESKLDFYKQAYNSKGFLEEKSFNVGAQKALLEVLKSIYETKMKNDS